MNTTSLCVGLMMITAAGCVADSRPCCTSTPSKAWVSDLDIEKPSHGVSGPVPGA